MAVEGDTTHPGLQYFVTVQPQSVGGKDVDQGKAVIDKSSIGNVERLTSFKIISSGLDNEVSHSLTPHKPLISISTNPS